jgi:hypothetical protein
LGKVLYLAFLFQPHDDVGNLLSQTIFLDENFPVKRREGQFTFPHIANKSAWCFNERIAEAFSHYAACGHSPTAHSLSFCAERER